MIRPARDLRLESVGKRYPTPRGEAVIVEGVDLTIEEGELVSLIGHSGCGKSTVLSMVAGLTPITSGRILVAGRPVRGPGHDRGVVFQAPCLFPWLDVLGNVRLGIDQVFADSSPRERDARAQAALHGVGLGDSLHVRPSALSAGMRQRVSLARALALEPTTLLLDEPFGMLDSVTRIDLQDMILAMGPSRPTTLLVTHDIDEAILLSDRIAVMTNGPAATIRAILDVPFGRQRDRTGTVDQPRYETLRLRLLALLESPPAEAAA
jgi:nitrate/nitrite transport system ATP-binding protein